MGTLSLVHFTPVTRVPWYRAQPITCTCISAMFLGYFQNPSTHNNAPPYFPANAFLPPPPCCRVQSLCWLVVSVVCCVSLYQPPSRPSWPPRSPTRSQQADSINTRHLPSLPPSLLPSLPTYLPPSLPPYLPTSLPPSLPPSLFSPPPCQPSGEGCGYWLCT